MAKQKPSAEAHGIVCRAPRPACVKAQIREGYKNSSAELKVPESTVVPPWIWPPDQHEQSEKQGLGQTGDKDPNGH